MIVTKKALSRRTVLRGIGAAFALPLLDSMVPAFAGRRDIARQAPLRFGVVYLPNGVAMKSWTPAADGTAFEITPILKPLAAFRDRLVIVSGLNGATGGGVHAGASTRFLTGVSHRPDHELEASMSADQIIARVLGRQTQLASLELGLDSWDVPGACDVNYACAYTNTISWRNPTTPLPVENNPRVVFERLFGDSGTTNRSDRLSRIRKQKSILDSVSEKVSDLERQLGPSDRGRMQEYVEAVRDVERRIQRAEEQAGDELPLVDEPTGIPGTYEEHAKLMFDLQALAYQCDLTRVITFMMGRELSGRTFPEIGISDAWHPTSHHENDPEKITKIALINTLQARLLAYYLEKLRSTSDGEGTLLDHMLVLYGAGMSDSNRHDPRNLPLLLAGGAAGRLQGGRHFKFTNDTPMANLLVTIMDKFDLPPEVIGNSTGKVEIDTLSGL